LHPLQRGFRRRPDGGARSAVRRGANGSAPVDLCDEQIFQPVIRPGRSSTPTQDITLGCYYLTAEPRTPDARRHTETALVRSKDEVIFCLRRWRVEDHRLDSLAIPDFGRQTATVTRPGRSSKRPVRPRPTFSEIGPLGHSAFTTRRPKSQLGDLIWKCYKGRPANDKTRRVNARQAQANLAFREGHEIRRRSIGIGRMIGFAQGNATRKKLTPRKKQIKEG